MPQPPWWPERSVVAGSIASARIGAFRLNPLKVIHRPTASSQKKIGTVASTEKVEPSSLTPRMIPAVEVMSSGAPTRPIAGMRRGTSRVR